MDNDELSSLQHDLCVQQEANKMLADNNHKVRTENKQHQEDIKQVVACNEQLTGENRALIQTITALALSLHERDNDIDVLKREIRAWKRQHFEEIYAGGTVNLSSKFENK